MTRSQQGSPTPIDQPLGRVREKFQDLLEAVPDAMVMVTGKLEIVLTNRHAEGLFGYEGRELAGKPVDTLIPAPALEEQAPHPLSRHPDSNVNSSSVIQLFGRRKDGSEFPVEISQSRLDTESGLIVLNAIRDVTEQRHAEDQARATAQYARSLLEASLDPLVTISPEGKVADVNEASVKVTGVEREALIGTDFSDYFTEPDRAGDAFRQAILRGSVADYPLSIRHKNGRLTDVLYNATVYKDANGATLGIFAAARDVTAQKQASQYARSLIEANLDALVTIGGEGTITDVNEAATLLTGIARDKLTGTDFSDYFTEPDKAREGYRQVFASGFVTDYPLTILHRAGRQTPVLYCASLYKDAAGNVLGVFASARDVTAQKRADAEAAEQRTKELERVAELERFQRLTVGRELKMIELKKEIEELRKAAR